MSMAQKSKSNYAASMGVPTQFSKEEYAKHGTKVNKCSMEGCTNQLVKRGVCKKHGAKVKHKQCSSEGCTSNVENRECA